MPETSTFLVVAGAAAVLFAVPGPALLLLLTRGLDLGPRGAVATAMGLGLGSVVHVVAAAVGLSALLATSATAFTLVKATGGLYLVWLGVKRWRDPTPLVPEETGRAVVHRTSRALLEGFTINALNPKLALFFLAFLPPFIDPARGSVLLQILTLGTTIVLVLLLGDTLFALVTGSLGRAWITRVTSARRDRIGRRALGGIYVGLGLFTLATGRRTA